MEKDLFRINDTCGFLVEISKEKASKHGVAADLIGFAAEMDVLKEKVSGWPKQGK